MKASGQSIVVLPPRSHRLNLDVTPDHAPVTALHKPQSGATRVGAFFPVSAIPKSKTPDCLRSPSAPDSDVRACARALQRVEPDRESVRHPAGPGEGWDAAGRRIPSPAAPEPHALPHS